MKKLLFVAAVFAMAACSHDGGDNTNVSGSQSPVTVDPTITRATEVDFEEGDAVGLTITNAEGTFAENAKLVYADGLFKGGYELLWYDDLGLESTLKAYYPYSESAPTTFTVQTDQTGSGYTASDLMMASKEGVTPSASAVPMTFKHKMTKIVINITNEYGMTVDGITIGNSVGTAAVDCDTQEVKVAEGADVVTIQAGEYKAGEQYAAIVVPQTAALRVEMAAHNSKGESKKMAYTLAEAQLQSGAQYSMNVTILPWGLDANLSGDIEDWENKGTLDGTETEPGDEADFEEFDDHFVYAGEEYKTVKMQDGNVWMAENLRYVPAGKTPSSNPADKSGVWYSAANVDKKADPELTATNGLLYDAATALGVAEITEENAASLEGTQGICPKGWHIPTLTEMTGLVGKCANAALDNLDAPYYDSAQAGALIDALNEDGYNWTFAGIVNVTNNTATGSYSVTNSPAGVDPVVYGAMSYVWGSTFYQKNAAGNNLQFYGFMSTWTAAYKRVTVAYANYLSGYSVRCVKDKE